jgi:hypothetical protein
VDKPDLPLLKDFTAAISPDGKWVALNFVDDQDASLRFAVGQDKLGKLVTGILETCQKAELIAPSTNRESVEGSPLMVGGLGVGPGRTNSEAILSVSVGPTTLLFAIELSRLLDMGELLRSKTTRVQPKAN